MWKLIRMLFHVIDRIIISINQDEWMLAECNMATDVQILREIVAKSYGYKD